MSIERVESDVISLRQVFAFLWRSKYIISGVTGLFAVVSVIWVLQLPDQYEAELLFTPNDVSADSGLGGLSGQLGGLASLAGLNIGANSSGNAQVALQMLKSRGFVQHFIKSQKLTPALIGAVSWDADSRELIYDTEIYDKSSEKWTRTPPKGKEVEPTAWEAYDKFIERMSLEFDSKSNVVTLSFEHFSPDIAVQVVNALIDEINRIMRERAIEEAEQSIDYLGKEIGNTDVAELKTALFRLVEEQSKTLMLAKIRTDYTFKVIADVVLPEDKSNPKRAFLCLIFTFVGGVFSLFIALIVDAFRKT